MKPGDENTNEVTMVAPTGVEPVFERGRPGLRSSSAAEAPRRRPRSPPRPRLCSPAPGEPPRTRSSTGRSATSDSTMRYDVLHAASERRGRRAGAETESERVPAASQGGRDLGGEGARASRRASHSGSRRSPRSRPPSRRAAITPGRSGAHPSPRRTRVSLVYLDSSALVEFLRGHSDRVSSALALTEVPRAVGRQARRYRGADPSMSRIHAHWDRTRYPKTR